MTPENQALNSELLCETDPLRRDRLWTLRAPALMKSAVSNLQCLVGTVPTLPPDFVASRQRRLGLYFEDLVSEFLQGTASPLHRNIQCRQDGRTLGEFDFIYRQNGRWHHLETAVKFYLCVGDGSKLNHYVGPGLRDRLDCKWQRLQTHQLQLSDRPAGHQILAELGANDPIAELLMPGYLFYRTGVAAPPSPHPDINPGHLRGFWCTLSEFRGQPQRSATRYAILPKLRWLPPARCSEEDCLDRLAMLEKLALQSQPVLISELMPLADCGDWIERQRGFVVPDSWPERAAKASSEP